MSKLIDYLEKMDKNRLVYIGTDMGGGWIAIDTAENIIRNAEQIKNYCANQVIKRYSNACKKEVKVQHDIQEWQSLLDEMAADGLIAGDTPYDATSLSLADAHEEYAAACSTKHEMLFELRSDDIFNRDVAREYQLTGHKPGGKLCPGTAYVVHGYIEGELWWKEEKQINY